MIDVSQEPVVVNTVVERGEISDELDYALANYIAENLGFGYTACQPQLVELESGNAIKIGLDHTFISKDRELMGYGIVGHIYIDAETQEILFCTPKEILEENIKLLLDEGIKPKPRPKGKY